MNSDELKAAHDDLVCAFHAHVFPCYLRMRAAMGRTFAVCGFGASAVSEGEPSYQEARSFAGRMARAGIPVVAGGPYTVDGHGRGIQHALHLGAYHVDPRMSIGCELVVPAWGAPAIVPCEPNLLNPDLLVTRLPTMIALSSCFVAFGRAAFGTDLERALVAQLLWFVRTLPVGGVPDHLVAGSAALGHGFVPRLALVGDAYDYTREKLRSWIGAGLVRPEVVDEKQGIYTHLPDARAAGDFVLAERARHREALDASGAEANNGR
jgi:hypothetical protein